MLIVSFTYIKDALEFVPSKIDVTEQMRGDLDENTIVDSDDAIHLLRHILFADRYPL